MSALPRDLHPVAWWLWAIGLATAASLTTNPLVLLTIVGVVAVVVTARRTDHPWARSFRFYVWLGVAAVVLRVLWRVVLGGGYPGDVVLDLPEIPLPDFVLGVTLLGPVTQEALVAGLYDGLRLATLVICVGAANSLANPKRLLRSLPPALYEIGTALVVAVTVLPQFTQSIQRVRAAQALRAGDTGRVKRLRRFLVPVLEDTFDRSLALAAGMDTRGYGRTGTATPTERRTTGALVIAGLCGVAVGVYALLDQTAPRLLAAPMLVLGTLVAVAGLVSAGRRVQRTRYRPDRWRPAELAVVAVGLGVAVLGWWVSHHQLAIAYPSVSAAPEVSLTALVAALLGIAAVAVSPPPRTAGSVR
ncbi:energy-coupling factor transporter transmembrane component T [Nocardioides sp.]|uniref:energy-coupling factor transporter transmembrane component T n=1 Tax=Nocardioides sp. TaxID=35761 RepID=UPI00271D7D6C|nr:energy-coupling factor transporter transmembrane component T [Nocardioides sp.]MDO9458385.1 energy-coupling factor transporter transmembrane component T [Nocardioides sp.]